MKIPSSPQLRTEDFDSTVQSWIGRLLSPLNSFITSVTSALNGQLTFSENMLGQEKALSFTYASNTLPLSFMVSFLGTPKALTVVAATENDVPVIVHAAWSATVSSTGATIKITDFVKLASGAVSALRSGYQYKLTVRVSA